MAIVIKNTNYNGEVLERLFTLAVLGCQIVDKGLICVIPNVTKKLSIPRLKTGKMLQKNKEMPDDRDSKGGWNYSEHVLEPEEFMAFTTFNPNTLYNIWRPYQPTGNLVFTELPPNVQNALLDALSKQVQFELGWHYINGEFGDDDDHLFNGILYRMEQDGDVKRISTAATTMIGKLYAIKAAVPETIKEHPNLRYIMSLEDWEQYDQELTEREHKNSDETTLNRKMFKGVKIETLAGWPSGLIIATLCAPDETGNLFAGVNLPSDEDVIQIDKLTNAGERYFFKMKLEIDTNIAFGEEVIVLDTRTTKQFPVENLELELSEDSLVFTHGGGMQEVTINASGDYHLVGKIPKGFAVKDLGGKLRVTAKANYGTSAVTGTVTLALDSDPSVTATLTLATTPNEARAIYDFESYNPADHTEKWGDGKVVVMSQANGKTKVMVMENPADESFVGQVFVVDTTEPDAEMFYSLKTPAGENAGIDVKLILD